MFHYWSKLRINLTSPVEPLNFLRQVDDTDKALFTDPVQSQTAAEIPASTIVKGIESMFDNILRLPFVLRHLLTYGGLTIDACLGVLRPSLESSPGTDVTLVFSTQSAEELLLQTVALKHLAVEVAAAQAGDMAPLELGQKADLCFQYALRQVLDMQAQQNLRALPFKFLFVIILLYVYGRPFHALGLLQGFESLIHNASPGLQQDS
jgi:hypothetical protein